MFNALWKFIVAMFSWALIVATIAAVCGFTVGLFHMGYMVARHWFP